MPSEPMLRDVEIGPQIAMDSMAMVEELAWLIKDNLPSKHLVLSAEDMFVEFLDPGQRSSGEDTLMLEPMISYHRMLLHRLADIFGLAHESIGEGDGRRLVVERCEDSSIPDVLVSDILECNDHDGESSCSQSALQLLKRNTNMSGAQNFNQVRTTQISFEERQAAYLAARERIFSKDWVHPPSEPAISRPRSVPVVARRMIAHALGKHVVADQCSKTLSSEPATNKEPSLADASCPTVLGSGVQRINPPAASPKVLEYSPAKAAKRMFAQALGLRFSNSSCRVSSRQVENRPTNSTCLQQSEGTTLIDASKVCGSTSADMSKDIQRVPSDRETCVSVCKQPSQQTATKLVHEHEQGKAAQKMLAQTLGFRSSSMAVEKRGKTFDGGTFL